MFESLKNGQKVVGAKQTKRAIQNKTSACVFLAEIADPVITGPIREMCEESNIMIQTVSDLKDLGAACGVKVGTAAAALLIA